jgi:hypothetical protein
MLLSASVPNIVESKTTDSWPSLALFYSRTAAHSFATVQCMCLCTGIEVISSAREEVGTQKKTKLTGTVRYSII